MERIHGIGISLALAFALSGAACAPPPAELQAARAEVQRASGGELAQAASADVCEARRLIQEADACVEQLCDQDVIRDLAYIAHRRIEHARIVARTSARIDADETNARAARESAPEVREAAR
jgi:hypothetical protein